MSIDNLIFSFTIWMHSFVAPNLPKDPKRYCQEIPPAEPMQWDWQQ